MRVSAIVAMSLNRAIGKDNQLPWHLPADLKHFKKITTGRIIVMGRKTHESIGRALPNRTNVILTRDNSFVAPDCVIIHSIDDALKFEEDIFIIGGQTVYEQFLPRIDYLYLTLIDKIVEGDSFFPELPAAEWIEVSRLPQDGFSFIELQRVDEVQLQANSSNI